MIYKYLLQPLISHNAIVFPSKDGKFRLRSINNDDERGRESRLAFHKSMLASKMLYGEILNVLRQRPVVGVGQPGDIEQPLAMLNTAQLDNVI